MKRLGTYDAIQTTNWLLPKTTLSPSIFSYRPFKGVSLLYLFVFPSLISVLQPSGHLFRKG